MSFSTWCSFYVKLADPGLHAVAQPLNLQASSTASLGAWAPGPLWVLLYQRAGQCGSEDLAAGMARGLGGTGGIQNKKETVQCPDDCLASYLEKVRSLEADDGGLESKIQNS